MCKLKYYYFIEENGQQSGPFTVEELQSKMLRKSTSVWTEGMTEWASAESIEELKSLFIIEPPPPPVRPSPLPERQDIKLCLQTDNNMVGRVEEIVKTQTLLITLNRIFNNIKVAPDTNQGFKNGTLFTRRIGEYHCDFSSSWRKLSFMQA